MFFIDIIRMNLIKVDYNCNYNYINVVEKFCNLYLFNSLCLKCFDIYRALIKHCQII